MTPEQRIEEVRLFLQYLYTDDFTDADRSELYDVLQEAADKIFPKTLDVED